MLNLVCFMLQGSHDICDDDRRWTHWTACALLDLPEAVIGLQTMDDELGQVSLLTSIDASKDTASSSKECLLSS